MDETPKKLTCSEEFCFLCKDYFSLPKSKIRVLGKSAVDIPSLILRATKVDVNVYVERERFAICRTKCYNRLVRYQNALRKFEEIGAEIQQDYQCDNSVRVKRLAKEPGTLPEAKKSLKFEDTSIETRRENSQVQDVCPSIFPLALRPGIVTSFATPSVFAFGAVSPITGIQKSGLIQKAFGGCSGGQMFTSTPRRKPAEPVLEKQVLSVTELQETQVHISVTYPCGKTVRKELKNDLSVLGKAIAHGPNQRIATAVLKSDTLKQMVVEKVLKLMTLQLNELCSRKRPSILRANTKEEIVNFDFEKACLELKARAPIFYAFLMTSACIGKENPEWLPSVAVAGSVLLKQRNSHMNACATIIGILLKSRSLEVRIK